MTKAEHERRTARLERLKQLQAQRKAAAVAPTTSKYWGFAVIALIPFGAVVGHMIRKKTGAKYFRWMP